ncbi:MAG: zinc-dependent alcohol dehydrogenase family protein [Elusimicrobia bacterium]|nr:zinc-dependent alcohol dehydrogenase family protein [Elusimicrobiota bacterium]
MKAWVLRGQAPIQRHPLTLARLPRPEPRRGEVRIKVLACGVCRTDLHIVEGDIPMRRRPTVCGHQAVGVIDALGSGVRRRLGERVGVPWLHAVCGTCADCRAGRENLCAKARFTGWDVDGGFAEWMTALQESAYPLPSLYADAEAAPLLCAGVIGYRALRLAGAADRPGGLRRRGELDSRQGRGSFILGLYGFGASAHLTLQVARGLDCSAYVFSRSPAHRRLARALGAAWAGSAEDRPPKALDGGIIFAPAGGLVPKALGHLRAGGTLALAGITMSPIPAMDYGLIYGERRLVSVANSTRQDIREFLALAARRRLRVETESFPFEAAPEALRRLKEGKVRGAAVLVRTGPPAI